MQGPLWGSHGTAFSQLSLSLCLSHTHRNTHVNGGRKSLNTGVGLGRAQYARGEGTHFALSVYTWCVHRSFSRPVAKGKFG